MTARNKVLTIMGIIILIGIISIGFFVFPIGISMCAITGLCIIRKTIWQLTTKRRVLFFR